MSVAVSEIGWGKYREYEGPFFRGRPAGTFILPTNPTDAQRYLAVVTATEGGNYMAINMYDRAVLSSGLIQWIEAGQYSVSDMLGLVASRRKDLLKPVLDLCDDLHISFRTNHKGQWRFWFNDSRGEVNVLKEQQQLFLLHSTGKVGTWDDTSKKYAKRWAAAVSSVWSRPDAQAIQCDYTVERLTEFFLRPYAREFFKMTPATDIGHAFKAMYISFAVNNPTWADRHLEKANKNLQGKGLFWTLDWLIAVAKELTFGPNVSIYPHRYSAIRPVLEKFYSVDLPDLADDLKKWKQATGHSSFFDTMEVQQALMALGYDLGPYGADGAYGEKTREAVFLFQQACKFPVERCHGMMDLDTSLALQRALESHGAQVLS